MTGLEIWLLAIGLAMDCFAVSIASGIILNVFATTMVTTIFTTVSGIMKTTYHLIRIYFMFRL